MKNLSINPLLMVSKIVLALIISTLSISCSFGEKVKGNGIIATEERSDIQDFDKIQISAGLSAIITQGEKDFVEVEADENILKYIITEIKNDKTLVIHWKKGINIRKYKKAKIHLTLRNLKEIYASSGSDVKCKNYIKTESLIVETSSAANVNIMVEANSVEANASSASDINIKGSTVDFDADASSGADISAGKLIAQNVKANASSGGDIKTHADKSIRANASSGGDIEYTGNPSATKSHVSSGGDIDRK